MFRLPSPRVTIRQFLPISRGCVGSGFGVLPSSLARLGIDARFPAREETRGSRYPRVPAGSARFELPGKTGPTHVVEIRAGETTEFRSSD